MPHYQRNVSVILRFCPTCNRMTMHKVDDRRVGNCVETHAAGMSKAQAKRNRLRDGKDQSRVQDLF